MTQEEKAKAYDEALERAKDYHKQLLDEDNPEWAGEIENIFPELKESEDEIRKGIIKFLIDVNNGAYTKSELEIASWIAWLEKQNEKEPFDYENANIQQKDFTPKDEPKFEQGEWIVWKDKYYKVNYNGCGYELIDTNGLSTSLEYETVDENAHLWTVAEAKDGDVLVASDGSLFIFAKVKDNSAYYHFSLCKNGSKEISDGKHAWETANSCHPATKEQRDTLFTKMREAGYEWNEEKKELRKMEQKTKWSDDEQYLLICKNALRKYQVSDKWDADIISKWLEDKLKH